MKNYFDLTDLEETKHDPIWHVKAPSETKGLVWSLVAAYAHTFSYNYDYLAFFIEKRNSNFGWYHPEERLRYIPLPTPTKSEFLEILEFRKSELTRVLEGTTSASDLYERLKLEGETSENWRQKEGVHWNQWHWPSNWGNVHWNSCIACGNFFYRNDPEEYIRLKERLSDTERAIKVHYGLATFAGDREKAIQDIGSRTRNAESIELCDPYIFYTPRDMQDTTYVKELVSVLPVSTLKVLDIFHRGAERSNAENELKQQLREYKIAINVFATESIHDRVWIVNSNKAFVIGTSFTGLGKKVAFILDLPWSDLNVFKRHLDEIRKGV